MADLRLLREHSVRIIEGDIKRQEKNKKVISLRYQMYDDTDVFNTGIHKTINNGNCILIKNK